MRQALMARDTYLVAGCAAAGAAFLAAGVLAADVAHAMVDPRGPRGCAAMRRRRRCAAPSSRWSPCWCSLAPSLAPYDPGRQFAGYPFAPPMRPHVVDDQGRWHAPFAYPVRRGRSDRTRYAEDRTRRILTSDRRGALVPARQRRARARRVVAPAGRRAPVARAWRSCQPLFALASAPRWARPPGTREGGSTSR